VRACVCACVRACVCACVRACVRACVHGVRACVQCEAGQDVRVWRRAPMHVVERECEKF